MWHRLRKNHSTQGGDVHIGLGIAASIGPRADGEPGLVDRLICCSGIGARFEQGQATRERRFSGGSATDFWDWVATWATGRRSITVWAFGMGRALTLLDFASQVEKREFDLYWPSKPRKRKDGSQPPIKIVKGLLCLEDPPTIVVSKHVLGGRVQFLDVRNYYRADAFTLALSLGLVPPRDPKDVDDWARIVLQSDRWSELAFNAARAFLSFVRKNDLGAIRTTIAAQSLAAFRHRGMKHDIVFHDDQNVQELERASYFGGQAEVYFRGRIIPPSEQSSGEILDELAEQIPEVKGPVYRLDCNGLFPYVMQCGEFPSKLLASNCRTGIKASDGRDLGPDCIAEVLVSTADYVFPFRKSPPTLYPVGLYWTTLAGKELAKAIDLGLVTAVRRWAQYKMEPLFSDWVAELWAERQAAKDSGEAVESDLWKLLLNCLYGKFGQLSPRWIDVDDCDLGFAWGLANTLNLTNGAVRRFRSICWRIQELVPRLPKKNSSIAISAFVTAAARVYMQDVRRSLPVLSLYYQGIDSLHVAEHGKEHMQESGLISAGDLGKFKVETVAESAQYWSRSDYQFGKERVYCGAKAQAKWDGAHAFSQIMGEKFEVALVRGPGQSLKVASVTIRAPGEYKTGNVDPYGWVRPPVEYCPEPYDCKSDCTSS